MTRPRAIRSRRAPVATARHEAVDPLRESEDRLRSILRAAMDGYVRSTASGRLLEVNDAYCRMSGYSERELLTMGVSDLEAVETPAQQVARGRRVVTHGPDRFESRHRRKDGTEFEVEVSLQYVESDDGCIVAFVRDITDLTESRARIRLLTHDVMAAREDDRKQLSAALHHDVGSLAVGVSAHLEAVEAALSEGRLGRARAELQRTRKLFEQSVLRLKELAVQLRPPELDVLGIRAALRQHFAQTTKHGGTRIRFTESLGRMHVPAAIATTLFRVAQEAVTNAITHGRATQVEVDLRPSKSGLTLTVRDHGQGFGASARRDRASQLGLRVMAEMAAAAGGTFELSGGPGKGVMVRVTLPSRPGGSLT